VSGILTVVHAVYVAHRIRRGQAEKFIPKNRPKLGVTEMRARVLKHILFPAEIYVE
jgi:hypothetical protein